MLIDTHAHINLKNFREDGDTVIRNALSENVWMINVGVDYKTSRRALDYANRYEKGVYAAVGLHPGQIMAGVIADDEGGEYQSRGEEFDYGVFEKLAQFEKAVAIGEIGLDYYRIVTSPEANEIKKKQKEVFWEQLLLARRLNKPVIIHCRQAHDDMLALLGEFKKEHRNLIPQKPWAVMHCFSGDEDLAWEYFNLGMMISFTGLITFSKQWDDLIRRIPNDKFMIETDCPFMTPEPYRGKRNEPLLVEFVARRIAEIRKSSYEYISDLTTENARTFFKI